MLKKCLPWILHPLLERVKVFRYMHAHVWYLSRKLLHTSPFSVHRDDIAPLPSAIGMSVSALCNARCRFCPESRGKLLKQKVMPLSLAEKLFVELQQLNYPGSIIIGENGEFLLCPDAIDILGSARTHLPNNELVIYTNMSKMNENTSRSVIEARPSAIHFNIDGADVNTYSAMKPGLCFEEVMSNVSTLLRVRDEAHSSTQFFVHIANYTRYLRDVEGKDCDLPDDTETVAREMRKLLRDTDEIDTGAYGFARWAIRDSLRSPKSTYCDHVVFNRNICYVAPDGKPYLCCLDDNAKLTYGSIADNKLMELWRNEKHVQLWNLIAQQRFQEVGEPCAICLSDRSRPSW